MFIPPYIYNNPVSTYVDLMRKIPTNLDPEEEKEYRSYNIADKRPK